MRRKIFGMDLFDVIIHVAVTGMVAGMAGQSNPGPDGDVLALAVVAGSLILLAWRRRRASRAGPAPEERSARLEELEDRVADLEAGQVRMVELEERMDFAERLLARNREMEKLTGPADER
jgi:hypothetical protein